MGFPRLNEAAFLNCKNIYIENASYSSHGFFEEELRKYAFNTEPDIELAFAKKNVYRHPEVSKRSSRGRIKKFHRLSRFR